MKKKIIIIVIAIVNLLALWLLVYNYKSTEYPELIFKGVKERFDSGLMDFLKNTKNNFDTIERNFAGKETNEDVLRRYFMDFLNKNTLVHSIAFVKGDKKYSVERQNDSYVAGYDTTKNDDAVIWKRIKNNKVISSWEEIFLLSFRNMNWFKDLQQNPGKIRWYFDVETKDEKNEENLFFSGYHYRENETDNYIIMTFARMALLKKFSTFSKYDKLNLIVETSEGRLYNLSSGINEFFKPSDNDSLKERVHRRLKLFKEKESGIFTFKNGKDLLWTFFRKLDNSKGINFYLLLIPQKELLSQIKNDNSLFISAYIILIIISLGLIYFMFYRKKKASIDVSERSLEEILAKDEGRLLEFKSSLRWDYRQQKVNPALEDVVIKTIAAFGNSDGGILLIGVDDDKNILGLENDFNTLKKKNADYFEIHLRNLLHKKMGVKYVTENVRIDFLKHENKIVCRVEVYKATEPVFVEVKDKNGNKSEKFYVRSGNSSHEINSLKDINDYISNRF